MVRSNGVLTFVYFYQLNVVNVPTLLSLMLHDSKLMSKLYYLRVPTSLLTGGDTKVALDSGLSLGAWKQELTATLNRKKQSVKGGNLLIEISLTKSSNVGSWSVEGKQRENSNSPFTVKFYRPMLANTRQSWILDPIPWILDSGCWIPVFSSGTWILDFIS